MKKTKTYQQSPHLLERNLREQFHFLVKSSRDYDNGDVQEAKRLATTIRIFVHDTKSSKSLLAHMKKKDKMDFFDTSNPCSKKNILPYHNLTAIRLTSSGEASYVPLLSSLLNENLRMKKFHEWWHGNKIIRDKNNKEFSRGDIILHVADTDGGAHVDGYLDDGYANLSKHNSLNIYAGNLSEMKPLVPGPELASIRQIAFELEMSLMEEFPIILNEQL